MNKYIFLFIISISIILSSCDLFTNPGEGENPGNENPGNENPGNEDKPNPTTDGLSYVFDFEAIPEITINFSLDEWNSLLSKYDANNNTKEYVHCDVKYQKGNDIFNIENAGIRLRGNTSRRRPENGTGSHVGDGNADWQHCHFGLNFRKYDKDDNHEIYGIRKINLKWFNNDPTYVREVFSYDLFQRAGVWTAAEICYSRLWINVEGDPKPAYYGIYSMIEPYDNKYIERKVDKFESADGNLWKCTYTSNGPADLRNENANMGEDDNVHEYTYELKETEVGYDIAKAQLQHFIRTLNSKNNGDEFAEWFEQICDVQLFIKTYAVNVALGMWDDHWNNGNNYYLYFNSQDPENYKVFFIPYDYDNTLGTSNCYDPAKQNPTEWGTMGKLMQRVIKTPQYKNMFIEELKKLVDPANGLMDYNSSSTRIREWQNRIKDYISNDTGEDIEIKDETAPWSNYKYSLLNNSNNYFIEKAKTINNL